MKRKLIIAFLCAAALFLLNKSPVQAAEVELPTTMYTTDYVNVRTYPSLDSLVVCILPTGSAVYCIEEGEVFNTILMNNNVFYISKDFLTTETDYNEADLRILSALIFQEAGNQCIAGQQAVGIVVANRVKSNKFANSVYDVLWEPGQFFNPNGISFYQKCLAAYDNGTIPASCIDAARYALNGHTSVEYNGQTIEMSGILFFSRYRSDCKIIIQDHQFA